MSGQRDAIVIDEFLPHPPAQVWRALTDPERLSRWFMANDFALVVGHRFSLDTARWGTTECEVIEIQPKRLLRYAWRNGPLHTEVTWGLEAEGDGTRLRIVHSGFELTRSLDRFAFENLNHGWRSTVLQRLKAELASTWQDSPARDDPRPG